MSGQLASGNHLAERAGLVRTRDDFTAFARELLRDFRKQGDEWENASLESFLEALAAWSADCGGYYRDAAFPLDPDKPQWRLFAEMLLAAGVYE